MNMVEEDDLKFLEKAISDKSYNFLKQIRLTEYDYILFQENRIFCSALQCL